MKIQQKSPKRLGWLFWQILNIADIHVKISKIYPAKNLMPYVNIKVTGGSEAPTAAQKQALIAGVTTLLEQVLGKNPQTTVVVIDEVDMDNWGIGGTSVSQLRQPDTC